MIALILIILVAPYMVNALAQVCFASDSALGVFMGWFGFVLGMYVLSRGAIALCG